MRGLLAEQRGHVKPLTDVASKCPFACDLTTEYDMHLLDAIITLATSGIPCACDGASAMVHLQRFTCAELLAMTTRNNRHIILYELSLETLYTLESKSENPINIG